MEVDLYVPKGADLSLIRDCYPDLYEEDFDDPDDDELQCWIGQPMEQDDSDEEGEWLTRDDAIDFCGFCEGAINGATAILEGNGGWAQDMIRCRDFSNLAITNEEKRRYKANSDRYWAARERGVKAARDRRLLTGKKRILTIRLKGKWWDQIDSGEKTEELRLQTDYWRKRLIGREYDEIHLWHGYPPKTDTSKLLCRRWNGVTACTETHEEFGEDPVALFAIDVSEPITSLEESNAN
ncbi:hypothetical protein [Rosistilla oblonga]|uniref:hypothetical protein n=1 Tax=Rosistilla oblonga TaxID=2527990 RepID=UPI003A96F2F4